MTVDEIIVRAEQLKTCDVSWLVKDEYIGNTFFDASSTAFILPTFESASRSVRVFRPSRADTAADRCTSPLAAVAAAAWVPGSGLGPEWLSRARDRSVPLGGLDGECPEASANTQKHLLSIYFSDSVSSLSDGSHDASDGRTLLVRTTRGQVSRTCGSGNLAVT